MLTTTLSDIRYAFRMLAKNPMFAFVVILTLALGIGANAAMFALTDRVLLQTLAVDHPDELLVVSSYDPKNTDADYSFSYPMYQDLRDHSGQFLSGVIARGGTQMNISYGDQN